MCHPRPDGLACVTGPDPLHAPVLSAEDATQDADARARRLDGGWCRVYSGPRPRDIDPLTSRHQLLAEVRLADPSAPPAVSGVAHFYPRPPVTCLASGTPTFFRTYTPDGSAPVFQATAGPEADDPRDDPDLIVSGDLEEGGTFELAELTYRSDRGAV